MSTAPSTGRQSERMLFCSVAPRNTLCYRCTQADKSSIKSIGSRARQSERISAIGVAKFQVNPYIGNELDVPSLLVKLNKRKAQRATRGPGFGAVTVPRHSACQCVPRCCLEGERDQLEVPLPLHELDVPNLLVKVNTPKTRGPGFGAITKCSAAPKPTRQVVNVHGHAAAKS